MHARQQLGVEDNNYESLALHVEERMHFDMQSPVVGGLLRIVAEDQMLWCRALLNGYDLPLLWLLFASRRLSGLEKIKLFHTTLFWPSTCSQQVAVGLLLSPAARTAALLFR